MGEMVKLFETLFQGGMAGTYTMVLIVMAIYAYFKILKPYLEDFNDIKLFTEEVLRQHININGKVDKVQETVEDKYDSIISAQRNLFRDFSVDNDKLHMSIVVDVNRLKEVIQQVLETENQLSIKSEENFKSILIELVKLESRLEFMNTGTFKGLQK